MFATLTYNIGPANEAVSVDTCFDVWIILFCAKLIKTIKLLEKKDYGCIYFN